jgi:hypothetical protein
MLRTALLILCGAMLPVAAATPAAEPAPAETTLSVTVQYTGAGKVSAEKRLWIWLFDRQPDPTGGSEPIATRSVAVNGGVARFEGLTPSQVWVAVMFDERGGYAADGPPPSGSPAWAYMVNDQQAPVTPRPNAAIQITFNDQYRLP